MKIFVVNERIMSVRREYVDGTAVYTNIRAGYIGSFDVIKNLMQTNHKVGGRRGAALG